MPAELALAYIPSTARSFLLPCFKEEAVCRGDLISTVVCSRGSRD